MPSGWSVSTYSEILLEAFGGGTPSKAQPAYWGGNIKWCSVKDLGNNLYVNNTIDSITEEGLNNSSANIAKKDALILCTRMAVGKIRIAGCDMAINQDLKGLIPSTLISRNFIIYQILSTKFNGTGTTVKGLQFVDFLNHPILLPPYNEQIRISKKLDFMLNQISY